LTEKLPLFILCGTKADLEDRRSVEESEGKKYASKKKARYYEVSSKES